MVTYKKWGPHGTYKKLYKIQKLDLALKEKNKKDLQSYVALWGPPKNCLRSQFVIYY